jgi:hypothetical protein
MSSFANERKTLKINITLVPHFLLLLPADPHSLFIIPAYLHALSVKGWVRTPVKVKKAQVYPKKLTFGLILDVSRRILTWIVRSKVVHASQKRRS